MKLDSIRELVRRGRLSEARTGLQKLKTKHLERAERLEAAYLAREADFPSRVIEILFPVIRPGGRGKQLVATPEEKGEYAIALCYLGLVGEARTLLADLALPENPRAADALCMAYCRDWDFKAGLQVVNQALSSRKNMRVSERLDLSFDRALCLLYSPDNQFAHGDYGQVRTILNAVLAEIGPTSHSLLRRFILRATAVSYLFERKWEEFDRAQADVDRLLASGGGELAAQLAEPISRMWRALAEVGRALERGGDTSAPLARLAALSTEFSARAEAGYAKSSLYHAAVLRRDADTLLRLYFSVSQEGARRRIETNLKLLGVEPPEHFDRALAPAAASRKTAQAAEPALLDLWDTETLSRLGLRQGQLPHRILTALASDAFSRPNLTHLFAMAFPDEIYRPKTSAAKAAQGLVRLRQLLKTSRAPLVVSQKDGHFFLEATSPVLLRIHRAKAGAPRIDKSQPRLKAEVLAAFGTKSFSARDFEMAFKVSARTANYRLREACEEGWLKRTFHGRATRYRVV